jgi:septum formation topological specificity factor MinE
MPISERYVFKMNHNILRMKAKYVIIKNDDVAKNVGAMQDFSTLK